MQNDPECCEYFLHDCHQPRQHTVSCRSQQQFCTLIACEDPLYNSWGSTSRLFFQTIHVLQAGHCLRCCLGDFGLSSRVLEEGNQSPRFVT